MNRVKVNEQLWDSYTEHHWGITPETAYHVQDDFLPEELVEMGKLISLRVRTFDGRELDLDFHRRDDTMVTFAQTEDHRLYLVFPEFVHDWVRKTFWTSSRAKAQKLDTIAHRADGRQNDFTYPRGMAKPIGVLTHVIYETHKKGDGPDTHYQHEMGEESGLPPILAADAEGRLLILGGDYDVIPDGIVN